MFAIPALPTLALLGNYAASKFDLVALEGAFQVFVQFRFTIENIDHTV